MVGAPRAAQARALYPRALGPFLLAPSAGWLLPPFLHTSLSASLQQVFAGLCRSRLWITMQGEMLGKALVL